MYFVFVLYCIVMYCIVFYFYFYRYHFNLFSCQESQQLQYRIMYESNRADFLCISKYILKQNLNDMQYRENKNDGEK